MKTLLKKPYDLFDLMKSDLNYSLLDNMFYPSSLNSKTFSNIKELEDCVLVEMIIPGFKKEEIEISIDNNLLLVKGKKELKSENENSNFILNEYSVNEFSRSFKVNPSMNFDSIESKLEDGILSIKVPKAKKAENKKIIKIN